jgi:hypothetical protein
MANVKISALPTTTATTSNDWLVKNNSAETTTSKVQLKNMLGMVPGSGTNSIQSAKWLTSLGTTANTQSAIAIGNGAEATSPYSIAIGYQAYNGNRDGTRDYYIAIGYQAQSIREGVAMGKDAQCLADGGFAIGNSTRVFGNGGFALGNGAESYSLNGIAIGSGALENATNASMALGAGSLASADYATAIGNSAQATHQGSVALGDGTTSIYSGTCHTKSLDVDGQFSTEVNSLPNLASFAVDVNLASTYSLTLNQNASLTFSNQRDGGKYWIHFRNTGSYDLTGVSATGGVVYFNDNGRKNLTHNSYDVWYVSCIGNNLFVNQTQNYV